MFANELEYKIPLPNTMRVAIINFNNNNIELGTKIQEKIVITINKKFQVVLAGEISELFKYKENNKEEPNKGLIDKKWINNIIYFIPSVIILNYKIQDGVNKESEEKNIYLKIEEIKKYSKSCFIFLIVIQKNMNENQNKLYFNFDDKQKPNYLKNYLLKDCLYILQEEEIWKLKEFSEICNKIIFYSQKFYKIHKKYYQENRSQSKNKEEKIEYDIKLGVISSIKSQKENFIESKYLEEAYEFLCDRNFDFQNYKYGNKPINIRNNFYEIRAAADWLFFKSNNFHKNKRTSSMYLPKNILEKDYKNFRSNSTYKINIKEQIKKCERHIFSFSNKLFYENGKKDYFHFVEYYWLIQRYINLTDYIEEHISNIKVEKKVLLRFGMILFKEVYNLIRTIKFYNEYFNNNEFNLSSIDYKGKKIEIENIKEEENNFFGKPPSYYILDKENPDKKEIIGFNDEIYIKKFILNNSINYDDMIDKFKNKYWYNLSSFFIKLKERIYKKNINLFIKNNNNDIMKGIIIYINLLKIIGLSNNKKNESILELADVYDFHSKVISNYGKIKKFPKVYTNFIKRYLNFIQHKLKKKNDKSQENIYKTELFINLSLLGNVRKLDSDEEKLFYDLLNDIQFIPTNINKDKKVFINLDYYYKNNIGIIKVDELAFYFDYSIKNIDKYQERKLLDLIEYEIKFKTSLNQEKIRFNSLKLFFEYLKYDNNNIVIKKNSEIIIKEFDKDELSKYELASNSPINIIYKFLIKFKKGSIALKKILFTLCKKENIFYLIELPVELKNSIFITEKETNALKMQFPKKMLISGLNQLFKFEYIINKEQINNIVITDYKHIFTSEQMNKKKLMSQIGDIYNNSNLNNIKNKRAKSVKLPNINDKSENKDSLINFIFDDSSEKYLSLDNQEINRIPPKFFFYDEEKNSMEESQKEFLYITNDFESRLKEGKNRYDLLIQFYNYGLYIIKLNIKYIIKHEEIDENLEFNHDEIFYFKVIDPLILNNKISSTNFLIYNNIKNQTKIKEYLTDTNINMNLIFKNLLEEDILIKDIIITLNKNQDIEIHSTVKEILDTPDIEVQIKEQILCILQSSNYVIPYNIKFFSSFNGSLGKIKIIWTTQSLKIFEKNKKFKNSFNFKNENIYELPNIDINRIQLSLDYDYSIKNDNEIFINIKICNKSSYNKNLSVKFENNDDNSYMISGLTKFLINLKNGEMKKIFLRIVALQKGEIKLPDLVIKEKDYNGYQISCNYFCPEKIFIR